jgi:hypothetical protein
VSAARKPKALLDAEKKIAELEKALELAKKQEHSWFENYQKEKETSDGIHEVLDDLGIRGFKDETAKYNRLPLAVRLFSWAMNLASGKKGE